MLKAIIHINFSSIKRQRQALNNISNILKEDGGDAELIVVCDGEGIALLIKEESQLVEEVEQLIKAKVRFVACEISLREKEGELLPGVTKTPSGAVKIISKQQEGFGYFKP